MRTLRLEDRGQDFLEFDIDEKNKIVATRPFQGWLWNGRRIKAETVRVGVRPILMHKRAKLYLNYAITAIKVAR